ncbi:hypothetical protein FA15DRAFT_710459 [Coprinopsis marcescibilis]|uniref:Uncharacterized protein n=1 Tax=Coprinopsis marcescibilis TaxID=230819 RepID=A0A5C3KCL3_COPMA|nr:hypothetical protein FA15DRAFT_710459 [Coprinopsis marcescibilis]
MAKYQTDSGRSLTPFLKDSAKDKPAGVEPRTELTLAEDGGGTMESSIGARAHDVGDQAGTTKPNRAICGSSSFLPSSSLSTSTRVDSSYANWTTEGKVAPRYRERNWFSTGMDHSSHSVPLHSTVRMRWVTRGMMFVCRNVAVSRKYIMLLECSRLGLAYTAVNQAQRRNIHVLGPRISHEYSTMVPNMAAVERLRRQAWHGDADESLSSAFQDFTERLPVLRPSITLSKQMEQMSII